jgi:hypothetical protein
MAVRRITHHNFRCISDVESDEELKYDPLEGWQYLLCVFALTVIFIISFFLL